MALAIGILAAIVLITIVATFLVRRYPLELFELSTRRALKKAGLTRKVLDGVGYWVPVEDGRPRLSTLVLIHGVNDQAGTWAPIVPKLAKNHRLIIPDLPGHGDSAPASGPLTMQQVLDGFTKIVAAETGDEPIVLAGNSMGGWVALLYTIEHPQKVKQLILEDASGMTWPIGKLPLVPKTRDEAAVGMRAVFGAHTPLPPNYVLDAMVRRARSNQMLRMLQAKAAPMFVDNDLASIKAPVTMICGDSDGLLPVDYAKAMQSRMANAKLHVIERCGHIPHRQKPEQFASLLQEALGV